MTNQNSFLKKSDYALLKNVLTPKPESFLVSSSENSPEFLGQRSTSSHLSFLTNMGNSAAGQFRT